jgi:hypothetical protein
MKKAMINYIKNEKFDDLYTPDYAIKPLLKYYKKMLTNILRYDNINVEIERRMINHGYK